MVAAQAVTAHGPPGAGQDQAVRLWNRLPVNSPEEARRRIERMRRRWQAERAAIWAVTRPGGEAMGLIGWNDVDLQGGSAEIVY
ncbi:hypothetical protein ACFVT6_14360 [Streptomyces sp. NPDC058049]|uniref:hypothetical protein n=1 Tax=Streptomyces sp. NPDC058049 TaxID=3346314 RepID=UPI0036E7035B